MSRMSPDQAAARASAVLGRNPQDALETSVVLEAWGGIPARSSLPLSRAAGVREGLLGAPSRERLPTPAPNSSRREVLGLIAVILATTAWVAPLASAFGPGVTEFAWMTALPISLALQWFLRRRYFTGEDGLGLLRTDRRMLTVLAAVSAAVVAGLLVAAPQALAGALVVTWVGGLILVIRGWGVPYAVALLLATSALQWGVPVLTDVIAVVALTVVAALAALLTSPPATASSPTSWSRSWPTALIGGLPALLLVVDPTVVWASTDPFPVVALVPSLVGSLWGNIHLSRVWTVLQKALSATSLGEVRLRVNRRVFARIVHGAVGRLLIGTGVMSALTFALLAPAAEDDRGLVMLLAGMGCFGLIGFLTALLESFSRLASAGWVVTSALLAGVAAIPGVLPLDLPFGPLPAAAGAAALVAAPLVLRLVAHPDRTLATLL